MTDEDFRSEIERKQSTFGNSTGGLVNYAG